MMPQILSSKPVVEEITQQLKNRCELLKQQGCKPQLTIFMNNDEASKIYVRNKIKRSEEIGIQVNLETINRLHLNSDYYLNNHPFIIQQPCDLSKGELLAVLDAHPNNDVDGFSSLNLGKIFVNEQPYFYPCTPKGIITLLNYYSISLYGKFVTIIGKSNIVGKPLAAMLENKNATVALCHSRTSKFDLNDLVNHSDIIISAIGNRGVYDDLSNFQFRNNGRPILIDVGINRDSKGKICGDFTKYQIDYASKYTPVPGGIGPMTVISLCENVIEYYEQRLSGPR